MKYEFDLFISYSSKDRSDVTKLADSLAVSGIKVWLDEWQIQVGENIIGKISDGLECSRYLAVWLSRHSTYSKWVESEWQSKYWEEIESSDISVLPLLAEKCDIPFLLKGKLYADFSRSFQDGYNELFEAIRGTCSPTLDLCRTNLLDGVDAQESAEVLSRIAIRNADEEALILLWQSVNETKKPINVTDHCAYGVGRVMIESKSTEIVSICMDILAMSVEHSSEIIVDKFAFTAGEIALEVVDDKKRKLIKDFINEMTKNDLPIVSEHYVNTRERVIEYSDTVFD